MPTCRRSKPEGLKESFGGGGGGSDGSDGSDDRAWSPGSGDDDDNHHDFFSSPTGDFFSSLNGDEKLVRVNGADFGGSPPHPLSCCRLPGSAERRPCPEEELGGDAGAMRCGGRKSVNDALRFLCPRLRVEVE